MSFEPESIEHEIDLEDVLLQILRELRLHTLLIKEVTGLDDLEIGDLDE